VEIFPQDKQVAGSPTDSTFPALPTKLLSTNMEEIQLVKVRVLESMPNDADKMIHIASGCKPRRADCWECEISVRFFNACTF